MAQHVVHTQLPGQLVMLGCGSIGQAVLPLILRHLGVTPDRVTIVTADGRGRDEAAEYGIAFHEMPLTRRTIAVLEPLVGVGDFILNLSVDVSSTAIVAFAAEARRPLSRHRGRALGRCLFRPQPVAGGPLQLRPARGDAEAAP